MTRKLWSLNALATELDRDRRTIAAALRDVPADGLVHGHKSWRLLTAIAAVKRYETGTGHEVRGPVSDSDPVIGNLLDRLTNWREVHGGRGDDIGVLDVADTAKLLGADFDTVLTWLRAGCPYVSRGDFKTGKGFRLRVAWVIEWTALVYGRVLRAHDDRAMRLLRLELPALGRA